MWHYAERLDGEPLVFFLRGRVSNLLHVACMRKGESGYFTPVRGCAGAPPPRYVRLGWAPDFRCDW